jgi:hypothetical protein
VSGLLQVGLAVVIGAAVWMTGRWAIRLLSQGGPDESDPDDTIDVERTFRCTVCGMQLTVTHAHDTEFAPPRHCREEMEPVE